MIEILKRRLFGEKNLSITTKRGEGGEGLACFPSFFALLEDEWLPVKALNMCILVEVPHGLFRLTNEIWQVNSFYYVAKFSIAWFMCFFERIRSFKKNFRSLLCWLSSATITTMSGNKHFESFLWHTKVTGRKPKILKINILNLKVCYEKNWPLLTSRFRPKICCWM